MSLFFYNELQIIRKNKVLCLLNNNIEEYYWCLQQMFVYLSFKLTDKEYKNIDEDLKKYQKDMTRFLITPDQFKRSKLFELKMSLRDLDIKINKHMYKYGFLFPKIKAPQGFEGITTKLGLN